MELSALKVGQKVLVRGWDGVATWGQVDGVYEDIKNDTPGIDWTTDGGDTRWAYLDQVEKVR